MSLAVNCGEYITPAYPVPDDFNETLADEWAAVFAAADGCPYYQSMFYQCQSQFIRCTTVDENTTTIQGMCREMCTNGETDNDRLCATLGSNYFETLCSSDIYGDEPDCYFIDYGTANDGDGQVVLYVLVGVLLTIGLILLGSILKNYYDRSQFDPEADSQQGNEWDFEKKEQESMREKQRQGEKFQPLNSTTVHSSEGFEMGAVPSAMVEQSNDDNFTTI
jgi:hypothetical protein